MTCMRCRRRPHQRGKPTYWEKMDKEARSAALWRDVIIEVIATAFLMIAQCILPLSWGQEVYHGSLVQTSLGMGCVVVVMIETFGPFSGAHMNPAVSLAMVIAGKISILRGVFYVPAQCTGAVAGAAIVSWFTPEQYKETLAATTVRPELNVWQGVVVEILVTGCLVFTIFGATNEKRKSVFLPSIPIGMAVMLGVLTGAPYTGGSMNPARSLGPAVIMNIWEHHWIYWLGPFLGAMLATLVYHYCFDYASSDPSDENSNDSDEDEPNNNNRPILLDDEFYKTTDA